MRQRLLITFLVPGTVLSAGNTKLNRGFEAAPEALSESGSKCCPCMGGGTVPRLIRSGDLGVLSGHSRLSRSRGGWTHCLYLQGWCPWFDSTVSSNPGCVVLGSLSLCLCVCKSVGDQAVPTRTVGTSCGGCLKLSFSLISS